MKRGGMLFVVFLLGVFCLAVWAEDGGYVGSQSCKKCHPKIYRGWRSTLHPYKFQDVRPQAVVGDFEKNNTLRLKDKTIKLLRKGDQFFCTIIGADGKKKTYQIKYLIGEFWKQLYVTEFPNGELHILPAMWIVAEKKWAYTKYWPDTVYQYSCAGCHNTGVRVEYDEAQKKFSVSWHEKGVGCEACHGPGRKHIEAVSRGGDPYEGIVNPARIPDVRLAAMVCGACHIRGQTVISPPKDPEAKVTFAYPVNYSPGDHLDFVFNERPKLHPDDSSKANRQQYIDWKKSGHAQAGVLCWDCHDTHHKGQANRYQTKLPGNALCRRCHQVKDKGVHGIHSVNNCIGCHMPPTGKRAVKGDVHSHRFKVISPEVSLKFKDQPNSCNLCHYHQKDDPRELYLILKGVKNSRRSQLMRPPASGKD